MTEAGWLNITQIEPLLIYAAEHPRATPRRAGLFACGCCRCASETPLPEYLVEGINAADDLHDRGQKRGFWTERRRTFVRRAAGRKRVATRWEQSLSAAVGSLYTPDAAWGVAESLLRALDAIGTVQQTAGLETRLCQLLRDIFGNPFRPVAFDAAWRTDTAVAIARQMYDSREYGAMPILADALQDAGCEDEQVLNHCRDASAPHVRGYWVVDLVLSLG